MAFVLALTFAFHYQTPLSAAQVTFFSRFDVLVTHDPLPRAQVDALHAHGTKLFLYEWSVAFYDSLAGPWQRSLIGTDAVLNAKALRGGAGSNDADAWYFDPVHMSQRASQLAKKLRRVGYDGVFLDTTTVANVHPDARKEYERRHPGIAYDEAFSKFLAALKRRQVRIFTNQGYRDAAHYLPYADWDLTESLIGSRSWDEAVALFEQLPRKLYPHVHFAHLEYDNAERAAAISKLFDEPAYVPGGEPR